MAYYPSNCDTIPSHDADPCEETEFGRIRSAGFIRMDYIFDETSAAAWLSGIAAGQIISIPETNGESPKATIRRGPPYGYRTGAVLGYEFEATYYDPNYNSNCSFYNQLSASMNYLFFYRTSSHIYISDAPVSIAPNRVIKNDLMAEINWEVQVMWISRNFPCGIPTPDGVFEPARHLSSYGGYTIDITKTSWGGPPPSG